MVPEKGKNQPSKKLHGRRFCWYDYIQRREAISLDFPIKIKSGSRIPIEDGKMDPVFEYYLVRLRLFETISKERLRLKDTRNVSLPVPAKQHI